MSIVLPQTPSPSLSEMMLFTENSEESHEFASTDFSSQRGELKSATKSYVFLPKENTFITKEGHEFLKLYGANRHAFSSNRDTKSSPFQFLSKIGPTIQEGKQNSLPSTGTTKSSPHHSKQTAHDQKEKVEVSRMHDPNREIQKESLSRPQTKGSIRNEMLSKRAHFQGSSQSKHEKQTTREASSLAMREWRKKETKEWWELRYHQKEREGGGQNQKNRDQHGEQEENNMAIEADNTLVTNHSTWQHRREGQRIKPILKPPSIGVFALYYILTKIGIFSDGTSNFAYKKEIEQIDLETTETHQKRLDELKEALKKEQENTHWGVAVQVFSWLASFFAMIAGVILIATGIGAVTGAMLVAGGLIQVSNQIMELAGGWKKISALLPGDDTEKKRAVLSWIQIGIAVLCLILSGAGMIFGGGYAQFGEAMSKVTSLASGVVHIGNGVSTIGQGISGFLFNDKMGDIKRYEMQLAQLKGKRKDLMEKVELGVDRLEQLFEDLARSLEFEEELFLADQMLYR